MTTNTAVLAGGNNGEPAALAEWLNPINWQTFGTFEFPWKAWPETATLKFNQMIDRLERSMRTRVCFVRAAETKSRSGAPVPLHLHAALTATKPISCELVTDLWNTSVGRTDGDLALVEPYNPGLGGIAYIAKQINDHGCEWDCRNVHLFNRNIQVEQKTDHASLRSARRWQAQNVVSGNQPGIFLRAALQPLKPTSIPLSAEHSSIGRLTFNLERRENISRNQKGELPWKNLNLSSSH